MSFIFLCTLSRLLLLGCGKPVLDSTASSSAGGKSSVEVKIGEASRQFLTIEPALESSDVLQVRANLEQAQLKLRLAEEVLARQSEMAKRGVGLEVERFEAEMKAREAAIAESAIEIEAISGAL
jgi:multidrug efflux pump subunit AcrA (membrane-fusion protein)